MKKQNMIAGIKIIPVLFFLSLLVPGLQAQKRVSGHEIKNAFINTKEGVEYDGKIILGADERSIKAISDDGYLRIKKTTSTNSRELLIFSRGDSLIHEYMEDGRVKPFEPEGKAWLSEILPDLIRSTTIAAEYRVDQLYAKGGISKVVKALPELESDHLRAAYIKLLIDKVTTEEDISTIISVVGSQIQSDHFRYLIFTKLFSENTAISENLLKAVELIDSDHFKSRLIKPLIITQLSTGQQQQASRLLNTIESDQYKYQIFTALNFSSLSADALKGILKMAMAEITSDQLRSSLLKSLLESGNMTEERLLILIDNARQIESEHLKARFLQAVCDTNPKEVVIDNLRMAAKSIQSPHFYGEVMRCLNSAK